MSRWPGRLITKTPVTPGGSAPNASAPGVWTLPEMAYWKKQGLWPDASADAYWGYISYLMATSSLSNANNNLFVDSSGAFNPVSRNGNTTQGSVTPYGTLWSNYFDGSGDYITAPNNAAFNFGTGDFTAECWVYQTNNTAYQRILSYGQFGAAGNFQLEATSDTSITVHVNGGYVSTTVPSLLNTWTHIAVVRTSGSVALYTNGVLRSTNSQAGSVSTANVFAVAGQSDGSNNFYGYVSNVRIVKGTAVYTAAFTPPAAPLTAISGTSLLTCQSNRFRDASANSFTITAYGNTSVTPFSPFVLNSPGAVYNQSDISYWSGYFNGSSYLSAPDSSGYALNSTGWSFETFVNFTSLPASGGAASLAAQWYDGDLGWWFYLYNNAGTYQLYFSYSTNGSSQTNISVNLSAAPPLNTWNHIAYLYLSGIGVGIFWNGVQVGTFQSFGGTVFNSSSAMQIGARVGSAGAGYYLNGYLSNMRLVNAPGGSYSWPPTAPITAISGTTLLTLQSAAFTDNSTTNAVFTPVGSPAVTGNNPFQSGYYSNYFDGSGDYLTSATATAPGTGDFTVEGWFNMSSIGSTRIMYDARPAGTNGAYQTIYVDLNGYLSLYANSADQIKSTNVVPLNAWNHFALCRSGTSTKLFLNGVQQGSTYTDTNNWLIGTSRPAIGTDGVNLAGNFFTGYLSNIRSVNGTALYTTTFTPPTAPLTAISGTVLLTCQSSRFIDNSTNNFTITVAGNTAVQSFNPFYTATVASNGGSGYFDGSGDYITAPNSPAFNLGSGDFTLECWVYNSEVTNNCGYAGVWGGGYILYREATTYRFYYAGPSGSPLTSSIAAIKGAWTHLAVVRNGATLTFYVNGVSGGSTNVSTTAISFPAYPFAAGANYDSGAVGYPFTGYMAGLRLVKGTAVYTSAFTPPTTPPTPISGTSFLCNFTNAGTYDAAMQNNLETVGTAQVASAQAKYGTTSAYIPNATSLLKGPLTQNTAFGTGDFTVEAWIYSVATTSGYTCIFTSRDGVASNANAVFFGLKPTTNQLTFYTSSEIIGTSTAVSTGVWTHVALVRNSGATAIYINGTSAGTATFTTALTGTGLAIGNEYSLASSNGGLYVDDLRITKGYARYTANFTPPTQAFPPY